MDELMNVIEVGFKSHEWDQGANSIYELIEIWAKELGLCSGCHGTKQRVMIAGGTGWSQRFQEVERFDEVRECWRCEGTGLRSVQEAREALRSA